MSLGGSGVSIGGVRILRVLVFFGTHGMKSYPVLWGSSTLSVVFSKIFGMFILLLGSMILFDSEWLGKKNTNTNSKCDDWKILGGIYMYLVFFVIFGSALSLGLVIFSFRNLQRMDQTPERTKPEYI